MVKRTRLVTATSVALLALGVLPAGGVAEDRAQSLTSAPVDISLQAIDGTELPLDSGVPLTVYAIPPMTEAGFETMRPFPISTIETDSRSHFVGSLDILSIPVDYFHGDGALTVWFHIYGEPSPLSYVTTALPVDGEWHIIMPDEYWDVAYAQGEVSQPTDTSTVSLAGVALPAPDLDELPLQTALPSTGKIPPLGVSGTTLLAKLVESYPVLGSIGGSVDAGSRNSCNYPDDGSYAAGNGLYWKHTKDTRSHWAPIVRGRTYSKATASIDYYSTSSNYLQVGVKRSGTNAGAGMGYSRGSTHSWKLEGANAIGTYKTGVWRFEWWYSHFELRCRTNSSDFATGEYQYVPWKVAGGDDFWHNSNYFTCNPDNRARVGSGTRGFGSGWTVNFTGWFEVAGVGLNSQQQYDSNHWVNYVLPSGGAYLCGRDDSPPLASQVIEVP